MRKMLIPLAALALGACGTISGSDYADFGQPADSVATRLSQLDNTLGAARQFVDYMGCDTADIAHARSVVNALRSQMTADEFRRFSTDVDSLVGRLPLSRQAAIACAAASPAQVAAIAVAEADSAAFIKEVRRCLDGKQLSDFNTTLNSLLHK